MSGVSRQRIARLPFDFLTKQKSGVGRLQIASPPAAMKSAGPTPVLREGGDMRLRTPGWRPFGVFVQKYHLKLRFHSCKQVHLRPMN